MLWSRSSWILRYSYLLYLSSALMHASVFPITAGFDFSGSHFNATFTANNTNAEVDIPMVDDLKFEGTEWFSVQLSLQSHEILSDLMRWEVRLGSIPQATIYILEEIDLNFPAGDMEVDEGGNLTLNVESSRAIDQDFNFTVNITGKSQDSQCKLPCGGTNECNISNFQPQPNIFADVAIFKKIAATNISAICC